jgi:hypothetical protein
VNDQRRVLAGGVTILSREQISLDHFDLGMWVTASDVFDSVNIPRRASKTNQITETAIKQILDDSRTNKARGPGHEDWVIRRNDEGIFHEFFQMNCVL